MKLLITFWRLGYKVTLIKYAMTELHAHRLCWPPTNLPWNSRPSPRQGAHWQSPLKGAVCVLEAV